MQNSKAWATPAHRYESIGSQAYDVEAVNNGPPVPYSPSRGSNNQSRFHDFQAIRNKPAAVYQQNAVPMASGLPYPLTPDINAQSVSYPRPATPMTPAMVAQQISDIARSELFYTIADRSSPERPRMSVLNISTMNRILLHSHQHELAICAEALHSDPGKLLSDSSGKLALQNRLNDAMKAYCETIRNMSLMQSHASSGLGKDPFKMTTDSTIERQIMESVGLVPQRMQPQGALPLCSDAAAPRLNGVSRSAAIRDLTKQQKISRLIHAFGGGLALIIPMLVMVYVNGTTASVVTTCISMVLFALVIALKSNLGPNEVLAVTSAYAAVLVVFVGVRMGSLGK